jgi:hypothetical protein
MTIKGFVGAPEPSASGSQGILHGQPPPGRTEELKQQILKEGILL